MNNLADMMMETYLSESLALRIEKLESIRGNGPVYRDILDVNIYDAADKVRKSAADAVLSFTSGDLASKLNKAVGTLTMVRGVNVKDARRRIADKLIENNSYKF
jgi:hypothetical protein